MSQTLNILAGLAVLQLAASAILHFRQGKFMATASEKLDALGAKLDKISEETTGLVEQVRELKETAADASPEVLAKIDALLGKAESIDAKVDDVAPNPTPTPEPEPAPEEPTEPPAA